VFVRPGQVARLPSGGSFEFPVIPPYGPTVLKVVATTVPLRFVGPQAATGAPETFLTGISGLTIPGVDRRGTELRHVLGPDEWATRQVAIMTGPDDD